VIPAGSYTVKARGVDQRGFVTPDLSIPTSNVTVTLPPNNPPVAAFTYSCVQNVCSFDGRTSTDENAPTLTYSWTFGTGQGSGSGPIPTKTYTAAGAHTVVLTVRDEWNVTGTATQVVNMAEPNGNSAPNPVINAPSCLTRVCNFSAVGSADPDVGDTFTYLWNFGDGTTSTSTSPSKTFTSNQTFTVTLTVTDGWLNAATTSIQVPIVEPGGNVGPTSAIGTPVCTGLVCNFSGLTSVDPNGDPFTYAWNFGDGTVSTSATPVKTFAAAGTYTVTLTTTDGWGRVGTTATVTVIRP
jgi:PKD repeat protein